MTDKRVATKRVANKKRGRKPIPKKEYQRRARQVRHVIDEELAALSRDGHQPQQEEVLERASVRLKISRSTICRLLAVLEDDSKPAQAVADSLSPDLRAALEEALEQRLTIIDGGEY